jgi:flagellar hook capping protein FlgD
MPRAVPRLLPTLVVLALLVASVAAFAVAEELKLEQSPITDTRVAKRLSPSCRCETATARIRFSLRKPGRVTFAILDLDHNVVRTVARERRSPAGPVTFSWDGRDDEGRIVPEGFYLPRVRLHGQRRTIVLPNPIRVDVTPPVVKLGGWGPATFSPDGDGRLDYVSLRYSLNEQGRVSLFVDGRRAVRKRGYRTSGTIEWYGKVDGRSITSGRHALELVATDLAGNRSRPVRLRVRVLYIELRRDVVRAKARVRFGIRVRTHSSDYRWRFAGGQGRGSGRLLVLRAPRAPGRYTLYVSVNGHADRATVVVRRRAK